MIVRAQAMGNQWQSVALLLPGRTNSDIKKRWVWGLGSKLHQQARSDQIVIIGDIESGDNEASVDCDHPPRSQAASTSEELALSSDSGWQGPDLEKDTELRGSVARVLPQPASAREDAVGRVRPQHSPATAIHPASAASVQEQNHDREDGVLDRNLQPPFPHLSVCVFVCA